jgi:dihydrofolate reductase
MRKLKLQMRISVDGFVAEPNGGENWEIQANEKIWQIVNELPDSSDTLLIGRKMAENFILHFESYEPENPKFTFAQKMVNIPKVIFSRTLDKSFGKNTSLANGELSEEIAKLKNQNGKDLLVYGGASFVSELIAGRHIDEFYLFVIPVMINKGMRIFDLLNHRQKLFLITATPYENGVTLLHYKLNQE